MKLTLFIIIATITTGHVTMAYAKTIRYALIIGNDIGRDSDGQQHTSLDHAEREAEQLKNSLVNLAKFDPSPKRTRLIQRATRLGIESEIKSLARQIEEDRERFGNVESFFFFYYTGHGLEERLLLSDGPFRTHDLIELFKTVDADFSVHIFDACYSGSLYEKLTERGISPTPGLNMIPQLPDEDLPAKGSIWYVSSGAGQASYEDDQLGGVFTHYFIEALKKAPKQGPGITLDRIWEYAQSHTVAYTTAHRRAQRPEKFVSNLQSNAPIYFSFPESRSATLLLSEQLAGQFTVTYEDSQLTDVFEKQSGVTQHLLVYPGRIKLHRVDDQSIAPIGEPLTLAAYSVLEIHTLSESPVSPAIGENTTLLHKGVNTDKQLVIRKIDKGVSFLVGAGYGFSLASENTLRVNHTVALPLRIDFGRISLRGRGIYGCKNEWDKFEVWGYQAHLAGGGIYPGIAWDWKRVRVSAELGMFVGHVWQVVTQKGEYFDGVLYDEATKTNPVWQYHLTTGISALLLIAGRVYTEIFAQLGPLYSPLEYPNSGINWHWSANVGVSTYFRTF